MKVAEIRIHVTEVELDGSFYNPRVRWFRKQAVFLEVADADGGSGWGECWTFDRSADALVRFLQTEIVPLVSGASVSSIDEVWERVWSTTLLSGRHGMAAAALSGLDCALWDLRARRQGLSVSRSIAGGAARTRIPVYASGGLYCSNGDLSRLHDEMRGYVSQGFTCVKMKIGAKSFAEDLERLQGVREAIGEGTALIVDAVYSLDRAKAEAWLQAWESNDVAAVQAPFPARDWEAMRWLNHDCGVPVMVFEAENRYAVFRALLDYGAIGVMQFSPIAVGGVTAALKLIALAERYGVQSSIQCSSTWLAEVIALQVAGAKAAVRHVEIHGFHRILFDHAPDGQRQVLDGCIDIGSTIGFGFLPPPEGLSRFDSGLPDMRAVQDFI